MDAKKQQSKLAFHSASKVDKDNKKVEEAVTAKSEDERDNEDDEMGNAVNGEAEGRLVKRDESEDARVKAEDSAEGMVRGREGRSELMLLYR